jgi:hypothetical protein
MWLASVWSFIADRTKESRAPTIPVSFIFVGVSLEMDADNFLQLADPLYMSSNLSRSLKVVGYQKVKNLFNNLRYYTQSIAPTKEVNRNGNITQNHSGKNIKNAIVSTSDTKNANQNFPVDVVSVVIETLFSRQI